MRQTPTSSSPTFSRAFNTFLSRFPNSTQIPKTSSSMTTNRGGYQSASWNEQSPYKPAQWRSTVSSPLCSFCNKAVFPAEEITAAGQKFHKFCLKCTSCNALLNSGSINEHEKRIYCTGCYRRLFGPHGVGRGLGTTSSISLETPPISPNASRLDVIQTSNELINTVNDDLPRAISLNDSMRSNNAQTNGVVSMCGGTTVGQSLTNTPISATMSLPSGMASKTMSLSGNICPRCSKLVYSAEEVKAIGKSFHKRCYTCAHCKRNISGGRYSEHEGELYDNNCYQKLFGPKGVGFGIGSGALTTGD